MVAPERLHETSNSHTGRRVGAGDATAEGAMRAIRRFCSHSFASAPLSWASRRPEPVSYTRVPKPWKLGQREADEGALMLHAPSVVAPEVLSEARKAIPCLHLDRDVDSVDGKPMFQVQFIEQGQWTHPLLQKVFQHTVETKVLPLLRSSLLLEGWTGGGDADAHAQRLVLCEALLRVYAPGQRRVHPAHYDADALVTSMFEVDCGGSGGGAPLVRARVRLGSGLAEAVFGGGGGGAPLRTSALLCLPSAPALHALCTRSARALHALCTRLCTHLAHAPSAGFYVQPGPHAASRLPIALAPGDLLAHSFDMQHGVEVPPPDHVTRPRHQTTPATQPSCASRLQPCAPRLSPHVSRLPPYAPRRAASSSACR